MFERFTERAQIVVRLAQEEARDLGHNYIGTEHLLLGLLRDGEGLAGRALESFGLTLEAARARVALLVEPDDEVASGHIPFTPRAKKVLELALREARALEHDYIGTEHILLGIARENEGVASRILSDFGADAERIRDGVGRLHSAPRSRVASRPGGRKPVPDAAEVQSHGRVVTFAFVLGVLAGRASRRH